MINYCYIIPTLLIVLFLENIFIKIFKKFVKKKYCISYKYNSFNFAFQFIYSVRIRSTSDSCLSSIKD